MSPPTMRPGPGISVVICTRDRAESLRTTLEHLERDDRTGLDVEVVVVDNASVDGTPELVKSFAARLPVRYLRESSPGKGRCLNRALDEGGLREIVAVLDDDISPRPGWFHGVERMCARLPDYDYFSGTLEIDWPDVEIPSWARDPWLGPWAFSSHPDDGGVDVPMRTGWYPCGGFVWYRRRVFDDGRRFRPNWGADPCFALDLAASGFKGIWCPEAAGGHRIQPELLDARTLRARVVTWSRWIARIELQHPETNDFGRRFRDRPFESRVRWAASAVRAWLRWLLAHVRRYPSADARFIARLRARGSLAAAVERVRVRSAIDRPRMTRS